MPKVMGIDLGTTNSCVAIMEAGEPTIIENSSGTRTTPSVVALNKQNELLVGLPAKRQAATNWKNSVHSVKRDMGTNKLFELGEKQFTPEQISSLILSQLKNDVHAYLGEEIIDAIITVPAYFSDAQRHATKNAGKMAGLNVLRIINEPTAAALAYGVENEKEEKVIVYDLGGGTFDVSILQLTEGIFEVIGTCGNNHLGGDDFDNLLTDYIIKEFKNETDIDLGLDQNAKHRILDAAEKVKIELSTAKTANINLPFISATESGPVHLDMTITRDNFEELILPLVNETIDLLDQAMKDAKLTFEDIDKVLLVGGSTRIPLVQEKIYALTSIHPSKKINPDECVALGAAIQGGIINGDVKDLLLLDVTPLSLGVETQGGIFSKIIEKNTSIPFNNSKIFSTAVDNQREVSIKVYQGEREIAVNNKFLGEFILSDIEPMQRGVPQIEVSFEIDINGLVSISAIDLKTGNSQSITINSTNNVSEEELEARIKDAEINARKDRIAKEQIETFNKTNALIDSTNKFLSDNRDYLTKDEMDKLRSMTRDLALNKSEFAIDELTKRIDKIEAYKTELLIEITNKAAKKKKNANKNNEE